MTADRESRYPHAVDIPASVGGQQEHLKLIVTWVNALPGGADQWRYMVRAPNGDSEPWCRIGTTLPDDADALAKRFERLGAHRVR